MKDLLVIILICSYYLNNIELYMVVEKFCYTLPVLKQMHAKYYLSALIMIKQTMRLESASSMKLVLIEFEIKVSK